MVNFSNHPSDKWSAAQKNAAVSAALQPFDIHVGIVDVPFPDVDPEANEEAVGLHVERSMERILSALAVPSEPVFVAGEFSVAFAVTAALRTRGTPVVTATTRRTVEELPDGKTVRTFKFVQFRQVTPCRAYAAGPISQ